eukprot:TRINITY_DN19879_c0_g1_i1.p1 TRINITY_DN19879_c0_g1~~TRINITY_DN19879_c0_g1_i1.p1  ORF type:complete len:128 (+),score=54.08 TRINITY_DN19879_c0_g1_i1:90-473(+)
MPPPAALRRPGGAKKEPVATRKQEEPQFSREKVMRNTSNMNKIQVFVACTTGALAGTLGLTGLAGFLLYFLMSLITTVYMHVVVMGVSKAKEYLMPEQSLYSVGSLASATVTFIVVWTVAYDVAHVF